MFSDISQIGTVFALTPCSKRCTVGVSDMPWTDVALTVKARGPQWEDEQWHVRSE